MRKCPYCNYKTNCYGCMGKHIKTKHPDKPNPYGGKR